MVRNRTMAGHVIPGIVMFFFWVVVVILAIILLAFVVHWAGGASFDLHLGHFTLDLAVT
jgi:uncharacterized integral membrane protein